MQYIVY